ncbi:MAG: methyltransferase domain-containing protein [Acidobacteriota bacterium]|nr:methyltransferase domain-containing protein [Acidobacteriota bacterium]
METDKAFTGTVPTIYNTYLVPLIFEPYADDLLQRLTKRSPRRVLEVAAGTGVVTRRMAAELPESTAIVATDLNQAMLDQASALATARPVEWRNVDALQLPFEDGSFDAVVCQFGAMFFPDKAKAFSESRRVLKPGGVFLFTVWDAIEHNEFADTITNALAALFPDDPPRFLARAPYGYHDVSIIERHLEAGGFTDAKITTVTAPSRAESAQVPAVGFCQGTPLRDEIEARMANGLLEATDLAAAAIAEKFGRGSIESKTQAHVIQANR